MATERDTFGANGMSRRLFMATATCAAAASMLSDAMAQTGLPSAPRILKFSDHEPLGGMRTRFLKDVLFPAIEKESNGA